MDEIVKPTYMTLVIQKDFRELRYGFGSSTFSNTDVKARVSTYGLLNHIGFAVWPDVLGNTLTQNRHVP